MTELPPAHVDTPQQRACLRRNAAAKVARRKFPRGTRVEATNDMGRTGNGHFGTVVSHIAGINAQGGHLNVLWDEPHPFTGVPIVSRMSPCSLRVVP
jgi:hypothetical protein